MRKRHTNFIDIFPQLETLKDRLLSGEISGFHKSHKITRGAFGNKSGRRSSYIGVSRNSSNWQALINVKDKKKYIGTFVDELEAAKTYDLYAMAFQGIRAKLNFDYSKDQVLQILSHYISEGRIDMGHDD